jgi:hypothetical protein
MDATPMFERLEPRQLLSGNVKVSIKGDDVLIVGDNQANWLQVSYAGGGITFAPDPTTSVNSNAPGVGFTVNLSAPLDELRARMAGGNDWLIVDGSSVRLIGVDGGAGNDMLEVNNCTTTGVIDVQDRTGNNYISLDTTAAGADLTITTGSGADTIDVLASSSARKLKISAGNGNNVVRFDGALAVTGDLAVVTGAGNDQVRFGSVAAGAAAVGGSIAVNLGAGTTDLFSIEPGYTVAISGAFVAKYTGDFSLTGKAANTTVTLRDLTADDDISVSLAGQNNTLNVLNVASPNSGMNAKLGGKTANTLNIDGLSLPQDPFGKFSCSMTGKTANTVTATNVAVVMFVVSGKKGVSNATLTLPFLMAYGPARMSGFTVIGP